MSKHITESALHKVEEYRENNADCIPLPLKPFDPEKYKDEPGGFTRSIIYKNPYSKTTF